MNVFGRGKTTEQSGLLVCWVDAGFGTGAQAGWVWHFEGFILKLPQGGQGIQHRGRGQSTQEN